MSQRPAFALILVLCMFALPASSLGQTDTTRIYHPGLKAPVEIIKDRWGISHIYARNEADLFFAQGYSAARDRLFQLEIWRRQATGTVAEILGPREIRRDIGARLFRFRKDLTAEMNHYHPRGEAIISSFVRGINAHVAEAGADSTLLPIEFRLLGIRPREWTPDVVISRFQGLLGNVGAELNYGRAVALLGAEKVKELANFHPGDPDITLHMDGSLLSDDILSIYEAFRRPIRFEPTDIVAAYRGDEASQEIMGNVQLEHELMGSKNEVIGSNNWVIRGEHTASGFAIMANDPHRALTVPALRHWVHLNAPGWNVIGGGEPAIPGVSIGHNDFGAWGLTVFTRDSEDLYVYRTNPANPSQYEYDGRWEDMHVIEDEIPVKGEDPFRAELKYTRHGPVVYEDVENHVAYAVRAAWMEIGGGPYLASLRMNQARTWEEFREACTYNHIPGENMIWADREGNIGWQAAGISPIRPNWSGLVPVPGDGRYEWDGFLPIEELPHVYNPEKGFQATANANLFPPGYEPAGALTYTWADSFRFARVEEVLASGRKHTVMDLAALQTDYLSIPARRLVPLLEGLPSGDEQAEAARRRLLAWDYALEKHSVEAGLYVAWERRLQENMAALFIPQEARGLLGGLSMSKMIEWLRAPRPGFGEDPVRGRDALVITSLEEAVSALRARLGPEMNEWKYGRYKHVLIPHPLSAAVADSLREKIDVGPLPRGGNGYTVGNTGGGDNQTSGATFRIIVDTSDWDKAVGTNSPGQSGDPDSPYYDNLFEDWANDRYFPVAFSRGKVEEAAAGVMLLAPAR